MSGGKVSVFMTAWYACGNAVVVSVASVHMCCSQVRYYRFAPADK